MWNDGGSNTYLFNPDGQIKQVNSNVVYKYNPQNRRVRKDVDTSYIEYIYFGGQVIAEYNGTSWTDYILANGARIAREDGSGNRIYFHSDQIGSARLISDGNGAQIWTGTFMPFGYEVDPQTTDNNYKFALMERDPEAGASQGLDHAEARHYFPPGGRWLAPDPAGLAAANPTNPQSWNRYAYVVNNPVNAVDPLGLWCSADYGLGDTPCNAGNLGGVDGGRGECPFWACGLGPFPVSPIPISIGGGHAGGGGGTGGSTGSGSSTSQPNWDDALKGENLGLPTGFNFKWPTIWQTLGMFPIDNWCDYGPCVYYGLPGGWHPTFRFNACLTNAREYVDKKMNAWDQQFPAQAGRSLIIGSGLGAIRGAITAPPGAAPEGAIVGAAKGGSAAIIKNAFMSTVGRAGYETFLMTKATLQCLSAANPGIK